MFLIVELHCVTSDCSPAISVSSGQAMSRFEDVGYQAKFDIIEVRGGQARVQVMSVHSDDNACIEAIWEVVTENETMPPEGTSGILRMVDKDLVKRVSIIEITREDRPLMDLKWHLDMDPSQW